MFDDLPIDQLNPTIEHCHDPKRLRAALALIQSRLLGRRARTSNPDQELDRLIALVSSLGVRAADGPIGRDDPTYRSPTVRDGREASGARPKGE